jgi:condensin complex subunit 1
MDEEEKEPLLPDFSNVPEVNIKDVQEKLSNLRKQKEFFSRSIFFLKKLEKALKKATALLSSRNKFDVQTAIALFKTSSESTMLDKPMRSVEEAYKQMLTLVWDKDNIEIRKAVLMAYFNKYFITVQVAPRNAAFALNAAIKLVELTTNATLSSITCIEELVRLMTPTAGKPDSIAEKKDASPTIPLSVFKALWHIFETDPDTDKKRGALDLLRMAATASPQIISEKVREIVDIGLGPLASEDEFLARSSFLALSCIPKNYREMGLLPPELERKIWKRVAKLLHGGFVDSNNWFAAAETAIGLVFSFHDKPHKVSQKIIRSVAEQLWSMGSPPTEYPCSMPTVDLGGQFSDLPPISETQPVHISKSSSGKPDEVNTANHANTITQPNSDPMTSASQFMDTQTQSSQPAIREKYVIAPLEMKKYKLAKLFFLLGHIAIKILVFIEEKEHELKEKRRAQQRAKEQMKQLKMKNKNQDKGAADAGNKEDDDDDLEAEFGMEGSAEHEVEKMRSTAEKSLVSRSTLLGSFVRVIKYVIMNQAKFKSNLLQNSAVLALCKFMCIDDSFCRRNLSLLFTLLKGSSANPANPDVEPNIRANIIIALGDMAFRFPNCMDQWNKDIYEHLRDSNIMVKKNTLMVLTHLILNDMIKVKDSIADIALLIEDPCAEIADLARLFFQELGKKGNKRKNPIYNILPDTISRLSDKNREIVVTDKVFQNVMKFLMEFVDGEKQKVNLVERLCKRFSTSTELQMWRRTAFCINQISFSQAVTRKIVDDQTTKRYIRRLGDKVVWEYFISIITKARKFVQEQFKATFDGWENKLRESHEKLADMQARAERTERMASKSKRKFGDLSDIEEEDVMEVERERQRLEALERGDASGEPAEKKQALVDPAAPAEDIPIPKPISRKQSVARRNKTRTVVSSSSDDNESETSDSSDSSDTTTSEEQPKRGRRKPVKKKQPKNKLNQRSKPVNNKLVRKGRKQQSGKNVKPRGSALKRNTAPSKGSKRKPPQNKKRVSRKKTQMVISSESESVEDSEEDSDLEVTEEFSSEESS